MKFSDAELPVLGLGASLSLSAQPDPVMLAQRENGPQFIEYAGLVDVGNVLDEVNRVRQAGVPVLYHPSFINFCGNFPNSEQWLQSAAQHIDAVDSAWFAQDCAYCFWGSDHGYSTQLGYFVPPIFNKTSLQKAIERVNEVQQQVDKIVAVEPPPMTFIIGDMPLFGFFGELVKATDCAILLDMGHLVSYEMASGKKIKDELSLLPLDHVVEVHVAGGKLRKGEQGPIYIDAHENQILDETWKMFESMLPELPNVHAVCFECEGVDEKTVMTTLEKIRSKLMNLSASHALLEKLQVAA